MSDLGNKTVMAENINRLMEEKGVCRADVCKALGFKYSTFSDWCAGNVYPRIDKIEMMAEYFGVRKSDLVERRPSAEISPEKQKLIDSLDGMTDEQIRKLLVVIETAKAIL